MMDGRVLRLRQGLDAAGFHNVWYHELFKYVRLLRTICDALDSAPVDNKEIQKDKTYQMDYANRQKVKEALWDVEEGRYGYVKPELLDIYYVREVKKW
jgi:porphobilinogen synthase